MDTPHSLVATQVKGSTKHYYNSSRPKRPFNVKGTKIT
jgi:hypothetical protein